jgi:transposase
MRVPGIAAADEPAHDELAVGIEGGPRPSVASTLRGSCVGDVNSAALARTRMAKSVLDAGWSAFRSMLRYKAMRHGARFVETNERYSTQTCSDCAHRNGALRGVKGLRVRAWACDGCGVLHDRDTNAARNILRSGRNAVLQMTEIPAL